MTKLAAAVDTSQFEYTVSGIDGTVLGATTIFTTLAGTSNFCPTLFILQLTNVGGIVTGTFNFSLGFNGPTYDNILGGASVALTNLNDYTVGPPTSFGVVPAVPPSTIFKINVTAAESTASPYTIAVTVFGNYL